MLGSGRTEAQVQQESVVEVMMFHGGPGEQGGP